MKNIALCFDNFNPAGNAVAFAGMLRRSAGQLVWTTAHVPRDGRPRHRRVLDTARGHVVAAYDFLTDAWEPGIACTSWVRVETACAPAPWPG